MSNGWGDSERSGRFAALLALGLLLPQDEAQIRTWIKQLDDAGIPVNAYCANFPTDATDEHLDRASTA